MSSTGRGPRLGGPDDFYVTPAWCVDRFLDAEPFDIGEFPTTWIEPTAGNGAIIEAVNLWAMRHLLPTPDWRAVECRATAKTELQSTGARVLVDDYLDSPAIDADVVITNPPYYIAEKIIRKCRENHPTAKLAFLVRQGFLASETRAPLWKDLGMPDVYLLPNRPSFTPDGKTDSADYCWIVFREDMKTTGSFRILETTDRRIRRPR